MPEAGGQKLGFLSRIKSPGGDRSKAVAGRQSATPEAVAKPNVIEIKIGSQQVTAETVVPESAALHEEKQRASLETMAKLEAARSQIGEFCLTIGQGDDRAVMLNAAEKEPQKSSTDDYSKEWYIVFTKEGIRRVGLVSEITRGFDSFSKDNYLRAYADFQKELKKAQRVQAERGISQDSGGYTEIQMEGSHGKETHATIRLSDNFMIRSRLAHYEDIREETNEGRVAKALTQSIERAQAILKTQINTDRATLNTLNSVNNTLGGSSRK